MEKQNEPILYKRQSDGSWKQVANFKGPIPKIKKKTTKEDILKLGQHWKNVLDKAQKEILERMK